MQGRETHFLNMRCFANLLELRIAMENLRLLSKKENQKITFSTTTEGKDDYIRIQEVDMIKKNNNKFQSFFNSLVNDYWSVSTPSFGTKLTLPIMRLNLLSDTVAPSFFLISIPCNTIHVFSLLVFNSRKKKIKITEKNWKSYQQEKKIAHKWLCIKCVPPRTIRFHCYFYHFVGNWKWCAHISTKCRNSNRNGAMGIVHAAASVGSLFVRGRALLLIKVKALRSRISLSKTL